MKLRVCALGAAALVLCSSSVAVAKETVRPSQTATITKSKLHVNRVSPRLQHANRDGALLPIAIVGVVAAGALVFALTQEDNSASR